MGTVSILQLYSAHTPQERTWVQSWRPQFKQISKIKIQNKPKPPATREVSVSGDTFACLNAYAVPIKMLSKYLHLHSEMTTALSALIREASFPVGDGFSGDTHHWSHCWKPVTIAVDCQPRNHPSMKENHHASITLHLGLGKHCKKAEESMQELEGEKGFRPLNRKCHFHLKSRSYECPCAALTCWGAQMFLRGMGKGEFYRTNGRSGHRKPFPL